MILCLFLHQPTAMLKWGFNGQVTFVETQCNSEAKESFAHKIQCCNSMAKKELHIESNAANQWQRKSWTRMKCRIQWQGKRSFKRIQCNSWVGIKLQDSSCTKWMECTPNAIQWQGKSSTATSKVQVGASVILAWPWVRQCDPNCWHRLAEVLCAAEKPMHPYCSPAHTQKTIWQPPVIRWWYETAADLSHCTRSTCAW